MDCMAMVQYLIACMELFISNPSITNDPDIPEWPEFTIENQSFMELNSQNTSVITTPHKERLEDFRSALFSARTLQRAADRVIPVPGESIL